MATDSCKPLAPGTGCGSDAEGFGSKVRQWGHIRVV